MSSNPTSAFRSLVVRTARSLEGAWAALVAGSRAIPLGDNGAVIGELAAHLAAPKRRA